MSDISDIASAIATILDGLSWVDSASSTTFAPAVTVASCSAHVVPFGQEATSEPVNLGGTYHRVTYRLPIEFWCKHTPGAQTTVMELARDAGTLAMVALLDNDGSGYQLSEDVGFEERIEQTFVPHGNADWLVSTLIVPIVNEVSI